MKKKSEGKMIDCGKKMEKILIISKRKGEGNRLITAKRK
jgi:hypothetical protein